MSNLVRALILAALPIAAAAEPLPAPPMPPPPPPGADLGKWWKSSEIAGALAITPAQVQKIEQTFLEHRLKLIDLRADLEREETRLQPLIDADQPDEAQVGAAVDRALAARGRLEKTNTMMMLAIRRVLSLDQWRKLESIKQEREARVHHFITSDHMEMVGPGGPPTFDLPAPPPPGAPHDGPPPQQPRQPAPPARPR